MHLQAPFILPCKSSVINCHLLILTALTMPIIILSCLHTRQNLDKDSRQWTEAVKSHTLYKNLWLYKQSQQKCTNTKALYKMTFAKMN